MKPEVVIRVRDLTVGFDGPPVLDKLSVDVFRGEIFGLVGGSGSGKSVLLRAIMGLLPRRSGSIEVLGIPLNGASESERRGVERRWGVLFQQGALFSSLTVLQNVQFPIRERLRLSSSLMDEVAMAKLEMVGLSPDDAFKFPAELSGGMTKRAALARALALDPEIVFLDEPTSGLDPISAADFDQLIVTLRKTLGLTVFMITHDMESLVSDCDRVAALAGGGVAALGTIQTMFESDHPWVQRYFRGKRAEILSRRHAEAGPVR
jgi:phospholipid/cholesterol/gamma-HCH transport system ATP-binding protein